MVQDTEHIELNSDEDEVIRHMRQAIADGKHWYLALLEAIGLWTKERETVDGRELVYLIENEALDWLTLTERLCRAVDGLVPDTEKDALLFQGKPPVEMTKAEFGRLIGGVKYRAYLNYFYGIAVEEALLVAVKAEVRKAQRAQAYRRESLVTHEAYQRIYGATQAELLEKFNKEHGRRRGKAMTLSESKQFTYWRFNYRVKECEPAKVASDTRKGLDELVRMRGSVICGSPDSSQQEMGVFLI